MNYDYCFNYFSKWIENLMDSGMELNNLVIYPFGEQGLLAKQILNWRYGIKEAFILDGKLCKNNQNIKSLEYLSQIDTSKFLFIITSDNINCYDEIRYNLRKYVKEENIMDLFAQKPLVSVSPRIASLELASREIYDKRIDGAVAEAGVYRGEFATQINRFFYDRKLYLFDTFEGFAAEDVEVDKKSGDTIYYKGRFSDTSIDMVLNNMPFVDNVVIKKGYFPNTAEGLDEKFCFVSLDMDLYQPIKAGLEYFYPRLSRGGYIFVHDCCIGNWWFKGARRALLEFAEKEKIGYVMIPDNSTAVITKY